MRSSCCVLPRFSFTVRSVSGCRAVFFIILQEHFADILTCRQFIKLFRCLSPSSLIGTCKNMQTCNFHTCTGLFYNLI
jgi:hypothetical protein